MSSSDRSPDPVALPRPRGDPVRDQRGGHLPQPQEPDRAADGDRAHVARGEPQLHRVLALPRRSGRAGIRVLHPHCGGSGVGDRPRHSRSALPQPQYDRRRRPGRAEGMKTLYLIVAFAPLVAAMVAGLFGRHIGRVGAHSVTIFAVLLSFLCSCVVLYDVMHGGRFDGPVYTWLTTGGARFEIGFLIDPLTALMMVVVTFVSLMVHIYTIGYMAEDPGYQRFFSYISLFTFSMLMLVMANNFLQLFFGWEAVGLVSYLLIGFWHNRPTAIYANLKALLVNRVGDFGFLLGIALVLMHLGSLEYRQVFDAAPGMAGDTLELLPGTAWSLITLVCILLFIGAMGKSAQFPLHVWLPDSMEGPTPISALIHA